MNRRGWLLAAWCVLLAVGVAWVQHRLVVSADLRLFLPSPRTEAQKLLVQNIGESPASRMLLVALRGDDPAYLARISRQMAAALSQRPEFDLVANGDQAPLAIPETLLAYRYLLTDSFDAQPLDAARLSADLADRAADMASPAAGFLEEWVPRDPALELRISAAAGSRVSSRIASTMSGSPRMANARCCWPKLAPLPSTPTARRRPSTPSGTN